MNKSQLNALNTLKYFWFSGSTQQAQPAAGLFGAPQPTASTGFGGGFGSPASSFGGATSAFKPAGAIAGGFGATSTGGFGGAASTAGGMFYLCFPDPHIDSNV